MFDENHGLPKSFSAETLTAAGFPTIRYDVLRVGQEFQSDERLIRPEDVETYAFATQDYDSWFFSPGPFGGPIAHPTILANQALLVRHNHYVVPAGLHARMVFNFTAPIPLGTRARTVGRVAEKYVRRDKPYMVTEFRTVAEDGQLLVDGRFVQMLFSQEKAPAGGSAPRPESATPAIDQTIDRVAGRAGPLEPGQSLPPLRRKLEQRQLDMYSGVRPLSIHTDPDWAAAKGFPTTIAQGMMSTAYVSTLMTAAVGRGFVVGGKMDARFLRPVLCGDTLDVTGTITGFSRDAEGIRVHVEVAAHNQRGEQTLAAMSSGTITTRAAIGGLGLCPSGCYGEHYAYFEPIHGTAPDIAGKNIINPTAMIRTAAMMLTHLGYPESADRLHDAIAKVYADGNQLTPDQGGGASTTEFCSTVAQHL